MNNLTQMKINKESHGLIKFYLSYLFAFGRILTHQKDVFDQRPRKARRLKGQKGCSILDIYNVEENTSIISRKHFLKNQFFTPRLPEALSENKDDCLSNLTTHPDSLLFMLTFLFVYIITRPHLNLEYQCILDINSQISETFLNMAQNVPQELFYDCYEEIVESALSTVHETFMNIISHSVDVVPQELFYDCYEEIVERAPSTVHESVDENEYEEIVESSPGTVLESVDENEYDCYEEIVESAPSMVHEFVDENEPLEVKNNFLTKRATLLGCSLLIMSLLIFLSKSNETSEAPLSLVPT